MEKKRVFEFRANEGKPIFSIHMYEEKSTLEAKQPISAKPPFTKNGEQRKTENTKQGSGNGNGLMSDAQKRYLFRLLAEQGLEGDRAYDYLKDAFQFEVIKKLTKAEASKMIEYLLQAQQGEKENDRSSF